MHQAGFVLLQSNFGIFRFIIKFTDRECPELEQPSLGQVVLSGRHFGGRATYTCPHGYHVVGLGNTQYKYVRKLSSVSIKLYNSVYRCVKLRIKLTIVFFLLRKLKFLYYRHISDPHLTKKLHF